MIELKTKRLALHYHIEATLQNGNIYFPSYFGRWIDSLSPYFKSILLIVHTGINKENLYQIESDNVSVLNLGEKPSPQKRILQYKTYQKILRKHLVEFDIIGYRVPSPLSRFLYEITVEKINFFLFVGHMINALPSNQKITWKSLIWKYYWKYDHYRLSKIANRNLTLSNGPIYLEDFPIISNQKVIFTSTIWEHEIIAHRNTDLHDPIKILFLGRISAEKRIDILLKAIHNINEKYNVQLTIAGHGDKNIETSLKNLITDLRLNNVDFLGHISQKEDIKILMDTHDIFIIPSEWDGQPRTIWEAMSRGMPIICSQGVKSPYILFKDVGNIEFFETNNAISLSQKIDLIISNDIKRTKMIELSLQTAASRTLEQSARLLIQHLHTYIIENEK